MLRPSLLAIAAIASLLSWSPLRAAAAGKKPAAAAASPAGGRRAHARTGRAAAPFDGLVKAARKKDRAALERLVGKMGPARVQEAVRSPDAAVAEAALSAVPLLRGRILLAEAVTERLDPRAPPALAAAAARALGELFDGASPFEIEEWEVPPDVVERACGGLRGLAARLEAPPAARLAALDALASAQSVCTATAELAPLLRDPVPAVRRAAALLLRPQERPVAAALKDALRDPDAGVVAAAAASVCRAQSAAAPAQRKADPLVEPSTAAARALAPAATTAPEDAVEMLACVGAAATPADRALIDRLRAGPPSPLRARAAELSEGGARAKPE